MKRIGIYIRVSTEEQARIQDGSLVSQRNRLIEYIDFQNKRESNWGILVDIYCDEGRSAKNMNGRPEFLRLLKIGADLRISESYPKVTCRLN
jgi:DNA invertase Pin-like site-specific DNA recombinase